MIITIDGPVATGKSTIARQLAESLGYIFFDTGAMYRALTYSILKHHIDLNNTEELINFLDHFEFSIKIIRREKHYFVDDDDVTKKIRGSEVTSAVSEVSANKIVREKLVNIQRRLAVGVNAVFEGRDMGSVVFPEAALKIFLTGRDDVRAKRRFDELKSKYPEDTKELTFNQCLEEITQRDHYDSTREHSPLIKAHDACVIDTSDISVNEIVHKILECKDSLKTKKI
ncbi:MAG: (d)CMP kinase [Parachlamydiaceae bacterium]|nr:(d)CMP kinase [Parachlamydiaceae bacterium]